LHAFSVFKKKENARSEERVVFLGVVVFWKGMMLKLQKGLIIIEDAVKRRKGQEEKLYGKGRRREKEDPGKGPFISKGEDSWKKKRSIEKGGGWMVPLFERTTPIKKRRKGFTCEGKKEEKEL